MFKPKISFNHLMNVDFPVDLSLETKHKIGRICVGNCNRILSNPNPFPAVRRKYGRQTLTRKESSFKSSFSQEGAKEFHYKYYKTFNDLLII